MFCSKCGTQFADGSAFCPICGTPVNAAPQQPQQPVYQQPVQPQYQRPTAPAGDLGATLKQYMAIILLVVACFGALMFILNTFQILDMPVSAEGLGQSESEYTSVSDIADGFDAMNESFALGYVANVLMGLCSLAAAAIGILYFLKTKNMPYYDQFIGKNLKGLSPALAMGIIGAAGCVLQFILVMLTGYEYMGMVEVSVSVPWLTWVALVIYGALAAVDYFVINKK